MNEFFTKAGALVFHHPDPGLKTLPIVGLALGLGQFFPT